MRTEVETDPLFLVRRRNVFVGFKSDGLVPPGSIVNLPASAAVSIYPRFLRVWGAVASDFWLHDIRIAMRMTAVGAEPIPADIFAPFSRMSQTAKDALEQFGRIETIEKSALDLELDLSPLMAGAQAILTVANRHPSQSLEFCAALCGPELTGPRWKVSPDDFDDDGERAPARIDMTMSASVTTRLRFFSRELDTAGADRDRVARVAGSLLDLAQSIDHDQRKPR